MPPTSPASRTRLLTTLFTLCLLLPLAVVAFHALRRLSLTHEFPHAADRFGYLEMAQDIRRGSAPHNLPMFTADSPHTPLLLDFFRARHLPVDQRRFFGPNMYHYLESNNRIICQYPPGTARMLALFPEGRALFSWQLLALLPLLALAGASFLPLLRHRAPHHFFAAAAAVLLAGFALLLAGSTASYSVDLLFLPTLLAFATALLARRLHHPLAATLLALLAGAAAGWCVVIRVTAALLLPAFLALLFPSRKKQIPACTAFLLGAALGVLPLFLHQHALTGSWFRSTYSAIDNAPPSLAAIPANLHHYFIGEGSDLLPLCLSGLLLAGTALASRPMRRRPALVFLLIPLPSYAYFLTHPIVTPYYLLPTWFAFLAFLTLWLLLDPPAAPVPAPKWRPAALIAAALLALIPVFRLPELDENDFRVPDTSLPPALRAPNAWIVGDRLAGTLWYYHGIVVHPISDLDTPTRNAFFRFVRDRHEPLFLLYDNPSLKPLEAEFAALGIQVLPAGRFAEIGVYQLLIPPDF